MKEIYLNSYIAFPIKESPLLDWLKQLNSHKQFSHFTIYFLGDLPEGNLNEVREVIMSNEDLFKNVVLKPSRLDTIGIHGKTFVLRIEKTEQLTEIRNLFESKLPEYKSENLDFLPHVTVLKKPGRIAVSRIPDLSDRIESYVPTNVGVYYRTEEDATALLFSHKI